MILKTQQRTAGGMWRAVHSFSAGGLCCRVRSFFCAGSASRMPCIAGCHPMPRMPAATSHVGNETAQGRVLTKSVNELSSTSAARAACAVCTWPTCSNVFGCACCGACCGQLLLLLDHWMRTSVHAAAGMPHGVSAADANDAGLGWMQWWLMGATAAAACARRGGWQRRLRYAVTPLPPASAAAEHGLGLLASQPSCL